MIKLAYRSKYRQILGHVCFQKYLLPLLSLESMAVTIKLTRLFVLADNFKIVHVKLVIF